MAAPGNRRAAFLIPNRTVLHPSLTSPCPGWLEGLSVAFEVRMTDSNVIYGVDFKGNSEASPPDVPDQLLILPVIRTERQDDTSPSEYVADSGDCA